MRLLRRAACFLALIVLAVLVFFAFARPDAGRPAADPVPPSERVTRAEARRLFETGRDIFRYDTFGDEDFWGEPSGFIRRSPVPARAA